MIHRRTLVLGGLLLAFLLASQPVLARPGIAAPAEQGAQGFQRITAGSDGMGGGVYGSLSGTGRYLAFESAAPDLMPGQIFGSWDTLIYDNQTGQKYRASVRTGGVAVENTGDYSSAPALSSNGRFVAFMSGASDLVPNDTNGSPDIFVHDRSTHQTRLVSQSSSGELANGPSFLPAITPDGRLIVFQSQASNLVTGDSNDAMDVFLRNMQLGTTERISVGENSAQGTDTHDYGFSSVSISDDGHFVAFSYQLLPVPGTPNVPGPFVYLRDVQNKTTQLIAQGDYPTLSTSGRYLAFVSPAALVANDTNNMPDVYLLDRNSGAFERISVATSGREAASQLITSAPDVTTDGRYVVFESNGNGLYPGDNNNQSDIFLRDRVLGTTSLISIGLSGQPANNESHNPIISADGTMISFNSLASDLTPGDTNGINDIFVLSRTALNVLPTGSLYYVPLLQMP